MSIFSPKYSNERAASMVEFAIFLPLLIILFVGLVEMGRLLSEYTWVAQATYNTTMLGSETSASIGEAAMVKRIDLLEDIQGGNIDGTLDLEAEYNTDPEKRVVTVSLTGNLSRLLNSNYGLNLNTAVTAPILLNANELPEDLNEFGDASCQYNCDGSLLCCGDDCDGGAPIGGCSFAPKPNPLGGYTGGGGGNGCFLADTKVYMEDGSYKSIQDLKVGDRPMTYNNQSGKLEGETIVKLFVHPAEEYWVVNESLLVTPNHPFLYRGRYVRLQNLKVGSRMTDKNRRSIRINSIRKIKAPVTVYNFEVGPNHTYMVRAGSDDIIVHNAKFKVEEGNGGAPWDG